MNENNNNAEVMMDDMDFEAPDHAWKTLKRLWRSVNNQHKKMCIRDRGRGDQHKEYAYLFGNSNPGRSHHANRVDNHLDDQKGYADQ